MTLNHPLKKLLLQIGMVLFGTTALIGCSSDASHLPAPWEIPGAVVGNSIENAAYGARRKKLGAFIQKNYPALRNQLAIGGGPILSRAFDIAKIRPEHRQKVIDEINQHPEIYRTKDRAQNIEALVVTMMVHS